MIGQVIPVAGWAFFTCTVFTALGYALARAAQRVRPRREDQALAIANAPERASPRPAPAMPPAAERTPTSPRGGPDSSGGALPDRPPGTQHSRLRKRIDVLTCGCTNVWDARTRTWEQVPCSPPSDLDEELRRLTS